MNPDLNLLQSYPFEKLNKLFEGVSPPSQLEPINLGIGEPQHVAPDFVRRQLVERLPLLGKYPSTRGLPELRETIANWLRDRFELTDLNPDTQVLPVNGTREGLFAFAQAVVDRSRDPLVVSPNPFYQIYEGAGLLAGAELKLLNCQAHTGFLPDYDAVSAETWDRCQLLFLCTPGNPSGAVTPMATLKKLLSLSQRHNFVIASDECYSEIYDDEDTPPPGLLQAAAEAGLNDYQNCMVFHSLSKRSNLPGLRSGFVAGDARLIANFLKYRTYHGCAMPLQHQYASIAAWSDEEHVRANRAMYRAKFDAVTQILAEPLQYQRPAASFYLWPQTQVDDREFARALYAQQHLVALPGQYLAREVDGINPGEGHIRLALVAPLEKCIEAAQRLRTFCTDFVSRGQ